MLCCYKLAPNVERRTLEQAGGKEILGLRAEGRKEIPSQLIQSQREAEAAMLGQEPVEYVV